MRIGYNANIYETRKGLAKPVDGIGIYTLHLKNNLAHCDGQPITPYLSNRKIIASHFWPKGLGRKTEGSMDLFHCTNYLAPHCKRIPVICTLHDAFVFSNKDLVNPALRQTKNKLLKNLIQSARHYIGISHYAKGQIIEHWGIPKEKVTVIYNGIDSSWFTSQPSDLIQETLTKYKIPSSFILNVGTLTPRKNTLRILQAYQRLPHSIKEQHPMVLIGREWVKQPLLLKEIHHLQEKNQLIWYPHMPLIDLQRIYQAARLFVFPSLAEGFGYPMIEAFASNTPVITSNTSALPEIAGDGAYLVDPTSSKDIENAMLTLLTDDELSKSFIKKGALRAQEFTWDRCLSNTIRLYKKFI